MYVDMWKDLLILSPLNEKYRNLAMEGLADLFRVSWGVHEPYTIYQSL